MSSPTYKGREPLPLTVIHAAKAGNNEDIEQVLWYYRSYINKLCTRMLYDETGCPNRCVDEYMKRRLEAKLTQVIIFMN